LEVIEAINEARLSRFHSKAIFVSGMGFFTDAYDLFIIGVASTLLAKQWHLTADPDGADQLDDAVGRLPRRLCAGAAR
jgi:MFS transporter, PHS family, inorganic phosphate transporter